MVRVRPSPPGESPCSHGWHATDRAQVYLFPARRKKKNLPNWPKELMPNQNCLLKNEQNERRTTFKDSPRWTWEIFSSWHHNRCLLKAIQRCVEALCRSLETSWTHGAFRWSQLTHLFVSKCDHTLVISNPINTWGAKHFWCHILIVFWNDHGTEQYHHPWSIQRRPAMMFF